MPRYGAWMSFALASRVRVRARARLFPWSGGSSMGQTLGCEPHQGELSWMPMNPLPLQVTETQAAQIQLDRAAEDYRRLHAERQQLIAQWDEAAAAMRRRDGAIRTASAAFAERRLALRRRKGELDAQVRFLEAEVAANRELEAQIVHYEKEVVWAFFL